MTVQELIDRLKVLPPTDEVVTLEEGITYKIVAIHHDSLDHEVVIA